MICDCERARTCPGAMKSQAARPHMDYSFTSPQKSTVKYSNNINDYRLDQILGKGGFGTVYSAVSKCKASAGTQIAVKMVCKS